MHLENNTCAVTHELVEEVSKEFPEQLRDAKGGLRLYETLFFLGFKIKWNTYNKDVTTCNDFRIRCNDNPRKCYKTKVYKGLVRNDIESVSPTGEITFRKNTLHHLVDEYNKYEVLQPKDIHKYIADIDINDIDDFGGKSTLEECLGG